MSRFRADVDRFRTTLLSVEPFRSRSNQIDIQAIDNTQSLNCAANAVTARAMLCDQATVTRRVNDAQAPYDIIVVIVNENRYGGAAPLNSNMAFATNDPQGDIVHVHELGHTIGGLLDEYNYGSAGQLDNQVHANCWGGNPPAQPWAQLVQQSEYAQGCGYTNWYRSSQDSLMKALTNRAFNAVSRQLLNQKIDFYTKP